ncbi:toxic anion resistance protein [Metalysinibacillus jejuensis]|uniref:toxic anion resistance protein n=1 Tax=Metalysinibacillus jejuensis TaxID=914327 RepID=UPI00137B5C7B|nr:toxic anion resistance protein [Metalysinibacillus jejuensis]
MNTFALLPEQTKPHALRIAGEINMSDYESILTLGHDTQRNISQFSDRVLYHIKNRDITKVGDTLQRLMQTITSVNVEENDTNLFSRFFKKKGPSPESVMHYERASIQIERIELQLHRAQKQLLDDIEVLNDMFRLNQSYHDELSVIIAAGELKHQDFETRELPLLLEAAEADPTGLAPQRVDDAKNQLARLNQRLYDLQIARELTVQAAPQIRMIQQSNQLLSEKIQTSLMTTIPLWKNQIALLISSERERQRADLHRRMSSAEDRINAHFDATELKQTQQRLLDDVEETLLLQGQSSVQQAQIEREMRNLTSFPKKSPILKE